MKQILELKQINPAARQANLCRTEACLAASGGPMDLAALAGMSDEAYDDCVSTHPVDVKSKLERVDAEDETADY